MVGRGSWRRALHTVKFQVMETVELAPGAEANIEVVCDVKNEIGLWTMNISKNEIVGQSSSLWDGIEINGVVEKKEGAVPFACSGDCPVEKQPRTFLLARPLYRVKKDQ